MKLFHNVNLGTECCCLHSIWRPSTHHTWSELESVDVFIMLLVLGWEGHSHIANAFLYPQIWLQDMEWCFFFLIAQLMDLLTMQEYTTLQIGGNLKIHFSRFTILIHSCYWFHMVVQLFLPTFLDFSEDLVQCSQQREYINTPLLLLTKAVTVLLCCLSDIHGITEYYVKPTELDNTSCPGEPCHTLNYFASNTHNTWSGVVWDSCPATIAWTAHSI